MRRLVLTATLLALAGCTTVDPGPNFVVPDEQFDADFFFCRVEPELLFAKKCGPGEPGQDPANGCHFNSSAVSGMAAMTHSVLSAPRTQRLSGRPKPIENRSTLTPHLRATQ